MAHDPLTLRPTPSQPVFYGQIHFGTFKEPFQTVNVIDADIYGFSRTFTSRSEPSRARLWITLARSTPLTMPSESPNITCSKHKRHIERGSIITVIRNESVCHKEVLARVLTTT